MLGVYPASELITRNRMTLSRLSRSRSNWNIKSLTEWSAEIFDIMVDMPKHRIWSYSLKSRISERLKWINLQWSSGCSLTLNRILSGQLDNDKAIVLCSMLNATIKVQNPADCVRRSNEFVSSFTLSCWNFLSWVLFSSKFDPENHLAVLCGKNN